MDNLLGTHKNAGLKPKVETSWSAPFWTGR
jgi:hypothetical protein